MNNFSTSSKRAINKLVPELRFPDFVNDEEWRIRKLKDFSKFFRGLTYSAKDTSNNGLLVLRSGNIQNNTLVLDNDLVYVNKECPKDLKLLAGDIVICMSNGSKALVGKNAEFKGNYNGNITAGAFCSIMRPSNKFTKYLIQTDAYQTFIALSIGGGNINNLKNSDLEEFECTAPNKTQEQQKIATCLSSLDDVISLHNQKLEALKEHRIGLMQNLFPQEGKRVPRYRFPEFEGDEDWVEKKLGEIGDPLMCKRIFKDQTSPNPKNGIPFYKIGTFGRESDSFIPAALYNELKSKYSFPNIGDILISASGTIGRLVVYDGEPAYFQDSNIVWLGNDEKSILNNFLFYCYSNIEWQTSDGGIIRRLYNSDLRNMRINFPEGMREQQKIASCLSSLDDLINAQTEKIEQLQLHKKGLMQGLFPKINH